MIKEGYYQEKSIDVSSKDAKSCQKGSDSRGAQRKCIWASLYFPMSSFEHFMSSLEFCKTLGFLPFKFK
jgi:hypothetical protein